MKVESIIGTYVFVKDLTTDRTMRLSVKDFGNKPQPGANVEYKDKKYYCTTK